MLVFFKIFLEYWVLEFGSKSFGLNIKLSKICKIVNDLNNSIFEFDLSICWSLEFFFLRNFVDYYFWCDFFFCIGKYVFRDGGIFFLVCLWGFLKIGYGRIGFVEKKVSSFETFVII